MTKTQKKAKKKYEYLTKAILLPDGTRKYFRAKTQKGLDEKVMKAQILVNSGVDICGEETFGHFAQMWYDMYKKPYLRENSGERNHHGRGKPASSGASEKPSRPDLFTDCATHRNAPRRDPGSYLGQYRLCQENDLCPSKRAAGA